MKRLPAFLLLLLFLFFALCACGHQHVWIHATCTKPETCTICGATKGDPLGHSWLDATCTAPKTCSVCSATEGAPLGHTPTGADYWTPSVCSTCGAELAPVLEPDFVKYGFDRFCDVFENYDYRTICENGTDETVGQFRILSYRTRPCSRDGYEEKVVDAEIRFTDANSRKSGVTPVMIFDDYYDSLLMNESCLVDEDGIVIWNIHWNGTVQKCYFYSEGHKERLNGTTIYTYTCHLQIPAGYDGVVIGAAKPVIDLQTGERCFSCFYEFCDEDSLFFRLN